ncbi:MAG: hypothetical protein ACXVLQ_09415 [Bacteriovorax sp.]
MKTMLPPFFFLLAALTIVPRSSFALDNSLKAFETDGCTMFVDGPASKPGLWRHCCVEHDMRYWFGGDASDMDNTDLRLKSCVNEVAGSSWAELIYTGVRIGHASPIKHKTHWGWGWTKERPNTKITEEESLYVIEELRRLPFDREVIEKFIERNFKTNHDEI